MRLLPCSHVCLDLQQCHQPHQGFLEAQSNWCYSHYTVNEAVLQTVSVIYSNAYQSQQCCFQVQGEWRDSASCHFCRQHVSHGQGSSSQASPATDHPHAGSHQHAQSGQLNAHKNIFLFEKPRFLKMKKVFFQKIRNRVIKLQSYDVK